MVHQQYRFYLETAQRQSKVGKEVACEVGQVDQAPHVCLVHQLELVPQAIPERDAVGLAGRYDALQQVSIVGVPAALLQAAVHTHTHHLPLRLTLHPHNMAGRVLKFDAVVVEAC